MMAPAPAAAILGSVARWLWVTLRDGRRAALNPTRLGHLLTDGRPPSDRVYCESGRRAAGYESGLPKEQACFKAIFSHGLTGSREDSVRATQLCPR